MVKIYIKFFGIDEVEVICADQMALDYENLLVMLRHKLISELIVNNSIKTDDIIFNFFKQICDEKDDDKCIQLGNSWIKAMNNQKIWANLDEQDR